MGADISALVLYSKYLDNFSGLGVDFDTAPNTGNDYQAVLTTLTFTPTSKLTLSGVNSYTGGTVVDVGTLEATSTFAALPETGSIIVNNKGELLLNVSTIGDPSNKGVGGNNPITVNGGMLTINGNFNAGYGRPITIDGGTLNIITAGSSESMNYINNLTLMNGATVKGKMPRIGYLSNPSITVSGTNACSIPSGLNLVQRDGNKYTMTFNIADVTDDSAADLIISGVIKDFGDGYRDMPIVKTGGGTLSFSGANTHSGVITINQGALALNNKNALNTGNAIVLNGGALDVGAFTNSVGTLKLSSNSTVVLGSGAIAFANSSALAWSGALTLTGPLEKRSVRFGTDGTGLTLPQLNAISSNGKTVRLDSEGYLVIPPQGLLILLR